jgi:serine/threonine protein kinase
MMRLDHPNIIKIYQVIESEDETLILMEYAPGGELIDYILTKKHLNETEARKFFRQIISAIDHCHMANVVHRDLKLENLLLSKDKNILITDFGLGRTFDGSTKDYMTTFCGTPNYAAIELISGIPYIGVKSDIWALGVILYVMMTGKPPFDGKSINALYKRIKKIDYKIPSYFSKDLAKLLAKIFVKDPEKRASINDLRDDPWVNYEEVEKPIRIFPINAQEMEQIVSGITKGNGYVSYIFREQSTSPKRKESNLNLAISQNSINDCQLLSNERRKSNVVDEIIKRKMNNSSSKSPLSPESLKSPFRNMTGCEIPNMDVWGGVLVDSTLSQKIHNKKYSSLMESGNKGLGDNMKNNENYHSVSDIAHSSNKTARNRHFLRLNTNVGYSQNVINTASVDERPSINPRYYSIVNISERNKSNNSSEDSINSSCDKIDGVTPLMSYSKSVSQITDELLYRNNSGTRLNNKSGLEKVKVESKQNKEIRRSSSFGFTSFLNKKKNNNSTIVNVTPSIEGNSGNAGPISPLNPNHPSSLNITHKRSNSAFSIPIVTKPINQNNKPKPNKPSPIKTESKKISKSINISPTSSKISSPSEILTDSFDFIGDSNSPEDDAIPNYHEIEMWHLIHKPSKTIRSTRLNFNKSTATSKPAFSLFQNLCWALYEMKNVYENRFYFARNSDYYLFECNLLNEDFNNVDVKFEVEVCKVWLLKIYALRFKRITGDPFLYEKLYSELISLLRADEDINKENSLKEGKIPISNDVAN